MASFELAPRSGYQQAFGQMYRSSLCEFLGKLLKSFPGCFCGCLCFCAEPGRGHFEKVSMCKAWFNIWMVLIPCAIFVMSVISFQRTPDPKVDYEQKYAESMIDFFFIGALLAYIRVAMPMLVLTLLIIHVQWFLAVKECSGKVQHILIMLLVFESFVNFGMVFVFVFGMQLFWVAFIAALPNCCLNCCLICVTLIQSPEPTDPTMLLQAQGRTLRPTE